MSQLGQLYFLIDSIDSQEPHESINCQATTLVPNQNLIHI